MNVKLFTGLILFGTVALFAMAQDKSWKDLMPLHSTRKDVKTLLGSPQASKGVADTFQLKDGRLRVFYSDDFCKRPNTNDWNVPPDTVVTLTFEPHGELKLDELNLDLAKYERAVDPHLQRAVHYHDREAGILITTRVEKEGEQVHSISREPGAKDFHLRCQNSSQIPDTRPFYSGLAFDEYGDLSFNREKPRLDNFAFYLKKKDPTLLGYLIVYRGRRMRPVDAQLRSKRAKDYMVKAHAIDANRIVTIMGGCREKLEVVLW